MSILSNGVGKPFSVQPATDHDLIRSELCSKLTKTTPEKCHWSFWCLVIINFKNLSSCSSVTICYWDFSYAESKPSMQHLILVVLVRVDGQKFDNTTIVICLKRNNRNLPCAEPALSWSSSKTVTKTFHQFLSKYVVRFII